MDNSQGFIDMTVAGSAELVDRAIDGIAQAECAIAELICGSASEEAAFRILSSTEMPLALAALRRVRAHLVSIDRDYAAYLDRFHKSSPESRPFSLSEFTGLVEESCDPETTSERRGEIENMLLFVKEEFC